MDGRDLRKARQRDGEKAKGRDEEVDEIMDEDEKVGFEIEDPLLDREYADYPEHQEIYRPSEGDALRELVDHEIIGSVDDIAAELHTDSDIIETALEVHDIEPPEEDGFNVQVDTTRLNQLVGSVPGEMVSADNQVLVATLYCEKGLSLDEIITVLEEACEYRDLHKSTVKQPLIDAHLLEGRTTEEIEQQRQQW